MNLMSFSEIFLAQRTDIKGQALNDTTAMYVCIFNCIYGLKICLILILQKGALLNVLCLEKRTRNVQLSLTWLNFNFNINDVDFAHACARVSLWHNTKSI